MSKQELLEELTATLCADPKKIDAMLVCADLLEELGDPRAAYTRAQAALRELTGAEREIKLRELRALYPADHLAWLARLEDAGVFTMNLTPFEAAWWGQSLPGREGGGGTYAAFAPSGLPSVPSSALAGDFRWLRETPVEKGKPSGAADPEPWQALFSGLEARGITVPAALRVIMTEPSLQKRIPSCTSNYFMGSDDFDDLQELEEGVNFLPFYSDQQSVVRWGVWLGKRGERYAPVISASIDWGDGEEEVDTLRYMDFQFAAPTVEAFLYRTWIENRIWYATSFGPKRELTDFEQAYVSGFAKAQ